MKHSYFWGCDPGLVSDPTGSVLLRVTRPAVVVQEGKVLDAVTGAAMAIPKDVTIAEFVSPRYSVTNVESRRGLTFSQLGREAAAIQEDVGGKLTCVVDSTGLGVGATDAIRRASVPCVGVTFTSGTRITGSRWAANVPVSLMFSLMYSVMSQNRIEVACPAENRLVEELKQVERRVSDQGRESFEVPRGEFGHGDCVYALGLCLVIAERSVGRQARSIGLHPGGRERPPGRPRQGSAARQVIKARLEASRLQSEATMWRQIGEDYDPGFE